MTLQLETEIAELETRAAELRTRFFATVDALDTRREDIVAAAERVRRGLTPRMVAGVLVVAVVGVAVAWIATGTVRARARRNRRRRRWLALLSPFGRRIVVLSPNARPSLLRDFAREGAKVAARASLVEASERLAPQVVRRVTRALAAR